MKQNIIGRIALCGLLTAANITLGMDDTINKALVLYPNKPAQQQSNKKTVFNGYYTNNLKALPSNLPIHTYNGEKGINNAIAKITYINAETNATQTVRFSGENNSGERLDYKNEKYHVILDPQDKPLFAIKMNLDTSSTSSSSSLIQISGNSSPRDDYDDSKFTPTHSQSNSSANSPRNRQIISEVLGGEKQIIHELTSDDNRPTDKQPSPTRDTITGLFTKDLSSNIPKIPVYDYVRHKKINATYREITYKQDENSTRIVTIQCENEHDDEEFLFVQENVMGLIKQYVINLNPEEVSTDSNSENGNSSTNSDETSLQDSEPKQQLQGSFIPKISDNTDYYEGLRITQTHEFHMKGVITENFTLYPSDNYQYQIKYKNKTGDICTAIFNCSQPLQTTSAYIITETDPILAIKLPTQEAKTTQLTSSDETSLQDSEPKQQLQGSFIPEILNNMNYYEGVKITQTHKLHIKGFTTENFTLHPSDNYQYQIEYKDKTGNICTAIFNCSQQLQTTSAYIITETDPILAIKLPTQEAKTTQLTSSDETSLEQTTQTNNNNNNNENDSSKVPTAGNLTIAQTALSHFCTMYNDYMPEGNYPEYNGEITESTEHSSKVTFIDNNNVQQEVWVPGTPENATHVFIKNSTNKIQCVIKLPTQDIQETPTQRVRGYLTSNSYDLSNITSIKQYQGEITKTEDLSVEITYTDETGKKQTIWAENTNTPSTPTNAIFENNQKIAQFIIKLPTQESKYVNLDEEVESQFINSDISKKSTSQRFNKNPNNRDPRYTYIGAAFLTLCIALAYKYNKLPDVFTQILDQCFAQLNKLTPTRFSH